MQTRALETRQVLITAAGSVFSRVGFENAPLTEICNIAGTTTGALYFHFASKSVLAHAVLEEFEEQMRRFCDTVLGLSNPPIESMVIASLGWCRRITTHPIIAGGVRLSLERPDLWGRPHESYDVWTTTTATLMSRARERGELSAGVDIAGATRFLLGAFIGAQVLSREFTQHDDFEQRVIELWRYTLAGLLPREGANQADQVIDAALRQLETRGLTPPPPAKSPAGPGSASAGGRKQVPARA